MSVCMCVEVCPCLFVYVHVCVRSFVHTLFPDLTMVVVCYHVVMLYVWRRKELKNLPKWLPNESG